MLRLGFAGIMMIVASCTSLEIRNDNDLTIVSGELLTTQGEPIRIWNQTASYHAVLTTDSFQVELSLNEPGYFKLQYGTSNAELYLAPGQDLVVVSAREANGLHFEGRSAASNNYLSRYQLFIDSVMPSEGRLYGSNEADFYAAVSQVRDASLDYLSNFIVSHHNLDPVFFEKERARIWYRWGLLLSTFPSLRGYLSQGQMNLSPSYYSFQKELSLDEAGLLAIPEYLPYVLKVIYNEGQRISTEGNSQPEHEVAFNLISNMISNPLVKDHCYHRVMQNILKSGDLQLAEQLMRSFKQHTQTSTLRREIVSHYLIRKNLETGNQAPPIMLCDEENNKWQSDQFFGEYLYLFAWKIDCPACIPVLKEMEYLANDFKEYPIRYVAVCLDTSGQDQFEIKQSSSLENFQIDTEFSSEFRTRYLIDGLPRAILIDPEGNLLNAFAPLPSSHNLRQYLRDALDSSSSHDHTFNAH